jgi:hypothetical protein
MNPTIKKAYPYMLSGFGDSAGVNTIFKAYNDLATQLSMWIYGTPVPVYISDSITGDLLDLVALGMYDIVRPNVNLSATDYVAGYNSSEYNITEYNNPTEKVDKPSFLLSDDYFKRLLTWVAYKGDGMIPSVPWLKRRIIRFLCGTNGTANDIFVTNYVSVRLRAFNEEMVYDVTLLNSAPYSSLDAAIFKQLVERGQLELNAQSRMAIKIG